MPRILPLLTMLVLIVASGLVHALWSSRWYTSAALEEAQERLPQVPSQFGLWRSKVVETDERLYAQAGAGAYWMRRYENARTRTAVSVILMCGRSGPMSVHTPDVCYRGAGYDMAAAPERVQLKLTDGTVAEFWSGHFRKGHLDPVGQLRLFWAWNATGQWQAPDEPRFTFRGQPALYKLYVIRELAPGAQAPAIDPTVAFLREFLPEMRKSLFPGLTP